MAIPNELELVLEDRLDVQYGTLVRNRHILLLIQNRSVALALVFALGRWDLVGCDLLLQEFFILLILQVERDVLIWVLDDLSLDSHELPTHHEVDGCVVLLVLRLAACSIAIFVILDSHRWFLEGFMCDYLAFVVDLLVKARCDPQDKALRQRLEQRHLVQEFDQLLLRLLLDGLQ